MNFDPESVRQFFPALHREVNGSVPVFLDGPGGTQVPQSVLDAMADYLGHYNSNLLPSPFFAVEKTKQVVSEARKKAAAFVNAPEPENIVFGSSMSMITAHISRSIANEWEEGDEIIVTALDHYANVSFWVQAAQDRGITCHMLRIHPEDCTIDYDHLVELLCEKTRLVAFSLASNVCGTRSDARRIIQMAKDAGALTYVDSVHAAPHFLPDVQELDCDFLVVSAYKFFGPHQSFLYGKRECLEHFRPYKVEPAPAAVPDCWESGTKNFEALAGVNACIDYLSSIHKKNDLRDSLEASYQDIWEYEQSWAKAFLERAEAQKGMKVYGITDARRLNERSPTFAFTLDGHSPFEVSDHLARHNIATGASHFYGVGVTDALGLTKKGGVVRIGCVHYNRINELRRFFKSLDQLS